MNISDGLYLAFNTQYEKEIGNSNAYHVLANVAANEAWDGFEHFFRKSAVEELEHAQRLADFLIDRNRTPYIGSLASADMSQSGTPFQLAQRAYVLEQRNTVLILELYKQCEIERDIDACIFLHWFVTEQRKSERELFDLLQRLTLAGNDYVGVKLIDAELNRD